LGDARKRAFYCAARKFQIGHDLSRTKQSATVGLMRIADI
jgi:hypothetical protein